MANDTDKQPATPDSDDANSTRDAANNLNSAAQEAMRMFREAQEKASQADDNTETIADRSALKETGALDAEAAGLNGEGSTTNELQQEAFKAMQKAAEEKRAIKEAQRSANVDDERAHFPEGMSIRLESSEGKPIVLRVVNELIVGRADDVTEYTPDIDLTPHGAYRLGLSRRHAVILRDDTNPHILVKDLNSRNGTFVNGTIVPGGKTQL
ncbi:MAG: FHA domain-containing protein [Chloroflexota bacterium]